MFDPSSRYHKLETAQLTHPDGRVIAYKRRRFLPPAGNTPILAEISVQDGDRLDNLAGRHLGDPTQFWRIADTNLAMNPFELTEQIGRILQIGFPEI